MLKRPQLIPRESSMCDELTGHQSFAQAIVLSA